MILVTANSVGFGPDHAEATGHEELQNKVDAMNLLIAKTVTLWGNEYHTLRARSDHQWMDWGQDGCSNPGVLNFVLDRTYNIKFRDACLRHDWMWRTLAALDEGTGKMWNERNRWKADKQILRTHRVSAGRSTWTLAASTIMSCVWSPPVVIIRQFATGQVSVSC